MADLNKLLDTKDFTGEMYDEDIQKNKVMGVLAYFSWLVLIPIFAAGESPFARFHVNQGLVLAVVEIIASAAARILRFLPLVGGIIRLLTGLIDLACFVLSIMGIVNAAQGTAKELPIIGSVRLFK